MKIRIIGHAGSGKTTLSKELSHSLGIPSIPLDSFLKQKDKKLRQRNLHHEMNKHNNWIIEGVHDHRWCRETFIQADLVIVLDYPLSLVQYRVIKRSLVGMKGATPQRKRFLVKRARSLLKWNQKFAKNTPRLKKKWYELNSNLYFIQSPKDINRITTIISFYLDEKRQEH